MLNNTDADGTKGECEIIQGAHDECKEGPDGT